MLQLDVDELPDPDLSDGIRAEAVYLLSPGYRHRLRSWPPVRPAPQFGTHVTARISLNSRGSFAQVSPAFSLANSSP
jgi:hypothetical protein